MRSDKPGYALYQAARREEFRRFASRFDGMDRYHLLTIIQSLTNNLELERAASNKIRRLAAKYQSIIIDVRNVVRFRDGALFHGADKLTLDEARAELNSIIATVRRYERDLTQAKTGTKYHVSNEEGEANESVG